MNYTQPYFGNTMGQPYPTYQGMYQNNQQPMQPTQTVQPMQTAQQQMSQPDLGVKLQGKLVDSIEVVKATPIPLDGSTSYFPLTDGTAIVTKQLQQDGTSKTVIYKPVEEETPTQAPTYVTPEDLDEAIKKVDVSKELKDMKRNIDDITDDLKDLSKKLNRKD